MYSESITVNLCLIDFAWSLPRKGHYTKWEDHQDHKLYDESLDISFPECHIILRVRRYLFVCNLDYSF